MQESRVVPRFLGKREASFAEMEVTRRSKFGRGSRSLHWGMLDLIAFRVKTSGHGKITGA